MQHLVFVYGTLRKDQSNHYYLKQCECLGRFDTPEEYALFDLGAYPAMILGKKSVAGEVYPCWYSFDFFLLLAAG